MSDSPPPEAMEDGALLRRWVERGDEAAVRTLTQRHAGLVLGTAKRALSGNQTLAEEAAQVVFTIMVAKAPALVNHPALSLWLHRAALLEASDLRRREARRQRRLAGLAAELDAMNTQSIDPSWQQALPELDEALERLPEPDRHLLVLRYYEGRNFKEIGIRLGKTDDTVQKQASRALEKLAVLLRRRGVVISTTLLATGMAGGAFSQPASAALAANWSGVAVTNAPHLGPATLSWQTIKLMSYGKSNIFAAGAVILLLALSAGGGYYTGAVSGQYAPLGSTIPRTADGLPNGNPKRSLSTTGSSQGLGALPAPRPGAKPPLLDILQAASTIRMSLTGDWSEYSEDVYPTLGHYDLGVTEQAIALLPEFRGDEGKFESVSGLIFSALAVDDWRAAKDRLEKKDALRSDGRFSGQAVRAVAEAWGREDPAAAFRWANRLIGTGKTPFDPQRGVGEKLLASWLIRDPAAALSEMDRRLPNQTPLVGKAVKSAIEADPQWWLDRLSPDTSPAVRDQTLRLARSGLVLLPRKEREAAVSSWVSDPVLAAELMQTVP